MCYTSFAMFIKFSAKVRYNLGELCKLGENWILIIELYNINMTHAICFSQQFREDISLFYIRVMLLFNLLKTRPPNHWLWLCKCES